MFCFKALSVRRRPSPTLAPAWSGLSNPQIAGVHRWRLTDVRAGRALWRTEERKKQNKTHTHVVPSFCLIQFLNSLSKNPKKTKVYGTKRYKHIRRKSLPRINSRFDSSALISSNSSALSIIVYSISATMNKAVFLYCLLRILVQWYYLQSICCHGDGYFLVPVDPNRHLSLVTPPPIPPHCKSPPQLQGWLDLEWHLVVDLRGLGLGQSPVVSPCPCPFSPPVNAACYVLYHSRTFCSKEQIFLVNELNFLNWFVLFFSQ